MRYKQIYDIEIKDLFGEPLDLSKFKGKLLLIVNIASKCGMAEQIKQLQRLYERFKKDGLVVIGCPSNQFLHQEPGSPEDIKRSCAQQYGVDFPITQKIQVNGKYSHPLFRYLKEELNGVAGSWVKWNFTKFLVDRMGKPLKRYGPLYQPQSIAADIEYLLSKEVAGVAE